MSETNTIEIKKTDQGAIIEFGTRACFIRRSESHPDKMTTVRFMTGSGGVLKEKEWSPFAWPAEACIQEEINGEFKHGFGTVIYLWVMFGEMTNQVDMRNQIEIARESKSFSDILYKMMGEGIADG